jgi:hypothetical protein
VASLFARYFAPFHSADAIAATVATLEQTVQLGRADLRSPDDAAIISSRNPVIAVAGERRSS